MCLACSSLWALVPLSLQTGSKVNEETMQVRTGYSVTLEGRPLGLHPTVFLPQ